MEKTNYLPGNTLYPEKETSDLILTPLEHPSSRPIVVLASNEINDNTVFLNGLTQNIVILYDLFESMGYMSYIFENATTASPAKHPFLMKYRKTNSDGLVKKGMPNVIAFIEIGMSIDELTRGYLRSIGTKIVKLYLGNIINIDIENIHCYSSAFFHHHIVGEIDETWTSPHYYQHIDYASVVNRTPTEKGKVAPYVWDPCFIANYAGTADMKWKPAPSWQTTDIVIMDPNISFQKFSFYSVLLVEAMYRAHPEWKGRIHVVNGDRMKLSTNTIRHFLQRLRLFHEGRVLLHDRKRIHEIMTEYPSACFITHQWNNEYNYSTLELMYNQFPILHNAEGWSNFGYYYSINEWDKAVEQLRHVLEHHKDLLPVYETHTKNLMWKHSIHHPDIRARWKDLLTF
jgi:hypothetical protein